LSVKPATGKTGYVKLSLDSAGRRQSALVSRAPPRRSKNHLKPLVDHGSIRRRNRKPHATGGPPTPGASRLATHCPAPRRTAISIRLHGLHQLRAEVLCRTLSLPVPGRRVRGLAAHLYFSAAALPVRFFPNTVYDPIRLALAN
jgi:hypothetical protein